MVRWYLVKESVMGVWNWVGKPFFTVTSCMSAVDHHLMFIFYKHWVYNHTDYYIIWSVWSALFILLLVCSMLCQQPFSLFWLWKKISIVTEQFVIKTVCVKNSLTVCVKKVVLKVCVKKQFYSLCLKNTIFLTRGMSGFPKQSMTIGPYNGGTRMESLHQRGLETAPDGGGLKGWASWS